LAVFPSIGRGIISYVVSGGPAVLNLRLNSRPDSAGLVRAALGGLAVPFALRAELLDDVKTAISEACNNAVDHAYRGQSGAITVRVDIGLESVEASVRDWGGGFQRLAPAGDRLRVGLPLINALADRTEFLTAPGSGTEVRMGFDIRHDPRVASSPACRRARTSRHGPPGGGGSPAMWW
jgi:anti-sigma regulatory factor (Ser/Thr protein kinase)